MKRHEASALFQLLLLGSVGVVACGGSTTSPPASEQGNDPKDDTTSSSSSSSSSSGGSSSSSSGGGSTSSSSGASSSGASSSGGGSTSSSGGGGSCSTGATPVLETYCCPADDPTCDPAYGAPDGAACKIDCNRVCDAVAPGHRSFGCDWTGDSMISYRCGSCGVGRIPDGTDPCPLGDTLAERLAHQAYGEAASVAAFDELATVLAESGAPADLVARACAAAADESRHASLFAALARAHGAMPSAPAARTTNRSLFALALENATEGCVRETFGALVTLHQSKFAASPDVRAAFAAIADDEAEHAALSWELKAWFDARLSAEERVAIDHAHAHALAEARRESASPRDAADHALGLPPPARARQLLDAVLVAMAA